MRHTDDTELGNRESKLAYGRVNYLLGWFNSVSVKMNLHRGFLLGLVLLGPLLLWPLSKLVVYADMMWFHEKLRQFYGEHIAKENWLSVPTLPAGMDYRWMDADGQMLRIGHALGYSGTELGNELSAVPKTRARRISVLEVDLWLTDDGSLRCFHGPGVPGPLLSQTCTFDRLLSITQESGEYLVLDIKTDFKRTTTAIDSVLQGMPTQRRRIVFQLYRPSDVKTFLTLPGVKTFAGPIVTAYVARSSLDRVREGAIRAGIKAFTFPLQRRAALSPLASTDIGLFVHPVHSCDDVALAKRHGYAGIYTLAELSCPLPNSGNKVNAVP